MQGYIDQAETIIKQSTKEQLVDLFMNTPQGRCAVEAMAFCLMARNGETDGDTGKGRQIHQPR